MQKIYVLTWTDGRGFDALNGAYAVCDSADKALKTACEYIEAWEDTLYDMDHFDDVWLYFTAKGSWKVEEFNLNDSEIK